jgi:hypothetical protein
MARPTDGDQKDSSKADSDSAGPRRTRRRRRALLNLGIPFVQVDDFLNQGEDAVALGYRVLEDAVEEIKKGYEQAKDFNREQEKWDGNGPPPPIPWEQLVDRVQGFQNIAIRAMKDSSNIFFDAVKSGTKSMKSVAKTFQQSRDDLQSNPLLAGPVFNETLTVRVRAGEQAQPFTREIRHRGLTRLRIHVAVDPGLKQLHKTDARVDAPLLAKMKVADVSFKPKSETDDEVSVLTVDLGNVPDNQPPGNYEGLITAKNFALLIAKLRVIVEDSGQPAGPVTPRKTSRRAGTRRGQ